MTKEKISIHNIKSLVNHMNQNQEFGVWWTVLCDIGPDWIGSSREVCFVLEGKPLSDNEFHRHLKDQLIKLANIPEKSSSHVINGEDDILLQEGKLIVEYWWTAAIPYQDPDQSGDGKGTLYPQNH